MFRLGLFEDTIRRLRNGKISPLANNVAFKKWFWRKVDTVSAIGYIYEMLCFGFVDENFFNIYGKYIKNAEMIGIPRGKYSKRVKVRAKPIYRKIDLEKQSKYVFCVDQVNIMKSEERLETLIRNLTRHSSKYIFLTCWGMDPEVPQDKTALHKTYWEFDKYIKFFKEYGFELIVRANYDDSFTMLYVFELI